MLNSRSERGYFYEMARVSNVYMVDKEDINSDSALFITGNLDKDMMLSHLDDLYEQMIQSFKSLPAIGSGTPVLDPNPRLVSQDCSGAQVACSNNI